MLFFYLFVLFWSPSWILTNHIQSNEIDIGDVMINRFNIHGIWMNYANSSYPTYCTNITFNESELKPILSYLNEYWTNYQNTTEFLEHEWDKHGTCAILYDKKIFHNELEYFTKGLLMYKKLHIPILSDEITHIASSEQSTTIYDLQNILYKIYNTNPVITCLTDENNNKIILDEIRFCFDELFHMIKCPKFEYLQSCSSTNITIPLL